MKDIRLRSFVLLLGVFAPTTPGLLARLFTSDLRVINTLLVSCLLLYPLVMGLAILLARTRRAHDFRLLRQAGQAVLLSVPFALLLGIAFRVMMRLVALAIGNKPSFSLGGTALIVLGFAVSGSLFTLLFVAARPWLPSRGLSKGLAFGMVLYVLFWHPFFRTASDDLRTVLHPVTIGLLTSLLMTLWIGYGLAVEATIGRLERPWPAASAGVCG